jgi:hypothetical protein
MVSTGTGTGHTVQVFSDKNTLSYFIVHTISTGDPDSNFEFFLQHTRYDTVPEEIQKDPSLCTVNSRENPLIPKGPPITKKSWQTCFGRDTKGSEPMYRKFP